MADYPDKENFRASTANKPKRQQDAAAGMTVPSFAEYKENRRNYLGCNSWIDSQIGRVIAAVNEKHADDTIIVYTSDHGDMWGLAGLRSKGPQMYEETNNVPFIVRTPNIGRYRIPWLATWIFCRPCWTWSMSTFQQVYTACRRRRPSKVMTAVAAII